jgi:hypothetical protein
MLPRPAQTLAQATDPTTRLRLVARAALALAGRGPILLRSRALAALPGAISAVGRRRRVRERWSGDRKRERRGEDRGHEASSHGLTSFHEI